MKSIFLTVTNDLSYDQRMIRISTSLSKAGYLVTLVGRRRPKSSALEDYPFHQKRLHCWFDKGKLFYLEYNLRLFFFLLAQKYDLLCAIDLDTILPVYICSRLKGVPCIYDAHEFFTELPEVVDRPLVKLIWEKIANTIIPRIKYAYTVGESLSTIFEQKYGTTFAVIRNLPFSQKAVAQPLQPPKILLYQGALNQGRGLEELIESMLQIEGAQLWLAGEGDLSESLRAQTKALQLENKVHFLGYLQPEALKKVTLQAYLGLNLLKNKGLNYYYSLANKAFDYIQAGIPSIHMNFPEYQKINAQNQVFLLINDLEISSIVMAIQKLIKDQELYSRLHQNCLKIRTTYTWEEEEKKLIRFYEGVSVGVDQC